MINQVIIPFIIFSYVLQVVELVFFPLPSDFTTYNIIQKQNRALIKNISAIAILIFGTIVSVVTFMTPGLLILFPEFNSLLHFVDFEINGVHLFSDFFIVAGSVMTVFGVLQLSDLKRHQSENGLIQSGIFRFTRNPITLGLDLVVIGFFLAVPAIEMLGGCIIYILNAHFRVLMEEKQLQSVYGNIFLNYKSNVSRYINIKSLVDLF